MRLSIEGPREPSLGLPDHEMRPWQLGVYKRVQAMLRPIACLAFCMLVIQRVLQALMSHTNGCAEVAGQIGVLHFESEAGMVLSNREFPCVFNSAIEKLPVVCKSQGVQSIDLHELAYVDQLF